MLRKRIGMGLLTAFVCVALCAGTAAPASAGWDRDELRERKEEVHQAAELLRELGVSEDDPAIQALSREWRRCDDLMDARFLGAYTVTGYDIWCGHCQGRWVGQTASGAEPVPGYTVAMCGAFPFGTRIYIEGLGVCEVQDRGVGPGHIDLACTSHEECRDVTGVYNVWVLG